MASRPSAQTRPPGSSATTSSVAAPVSLVPPRPSGPTRSLSAHSAAFYANAAAAKRNSIYNLAGASGEDVPFARCDEKATPGLDIDLTATDGEVKSLGELAASFSAANKQSGTPSLVSNGTPVASQGGSSGNPPPRPGCPVRGRPRMTFLDISTTDGQRSASAPANMSDMLPFPARPGNQGIPKGHQMREALQNLQPASRRRATAISKTVILDAPAEARKYPAGKSADFNPWTSTDIGDHLTPTLVKTGLASTPLVSLHDSNTARPSLWSSLKNKSGTSGLTTLSSLFCSVFERRQQLGKLTTSSTFRAPPRVALTEKAREAWMLELANPNAALRKLSKRIPHGIRGKGLLDECMAKRIPAPRAVWLAKCVGANEMRAFTRIKGVGSKTAASAGGEAMWVKEWTVHIQQFLEGIIDACGSEGWKGNIDYAIRLVSHIYSEHLLDQEQFLEWTLSSLEQSGSERLPLWLLMVQIYFKDLVAVRRRGRRLAEALLIHLDALSTPEEAEICKPVVQRMQQIVHVLALKQRGCFIAPKSWESIKPALKGMVTSVARVEFESSVKNIVKRNDQLLRPGDERDNSDPAGNSAKKLLSILDAGLDSDTLLAFDLDRHATSCIKSGLSDDELVFLTLKWASSKYRSGQHRTYMTGRLLRKWKSVGIDTETAILKYVRRLHELQGVDESQAFKLVSELCRSKQVSIGRYLQWLISSGALGAPDSADVHKRLLADIPIYGLPMHIVNLRTMLLQNVGIRADPDTETVARIRNQIQEFQASEHTRPSSIVALQLATQSLATKCELALWLRRACAQMTHISYETCSKGSDGKPSEVLTSTMSPWQFHIQRTLLEDLGDLSVLADVVARALTSSDTAVLAACADTLNLHARAFTAIGALGPLFARLNERYCISRVVGSMDRSLVSSFTDLATSIGGDFRLVQQLKLDLSRCEQQTVVQMCSPASDGMGELAIVASKSDTVVEEEIERALNSGTSMDAPAAGRVFSRVVEVMQRVAAQGQGEVTMGSDTNPDISDREPHPPFEAWLQKLRAFDDRGFERLVGEWITGLMSEQTPGASPLLSFAIPTIIGTGVVDLTKCVEGAEKMIETLLKFAPKQAAVPALNLLLVLVKDGLSRHEMVEPQHWNRFVIARVKLEGFAMKHIRPMLNVVARSQNHALDQCVDRLLGSEGLLAMVRSAAVKDVQVLALELGIGTVAASSGGSTRTAQTYIATLLEHVLDPSGDMHISQLARDEQVRTIIGSADEFSSPFCQLQIRYLLHAASPSDASPDAMTDGEDVVEQALLGAIKTAIERGENSWAELLSGFGANVCNKVRRFAEQQILSAMGGLRDKMAGIDQGDDCSADAAMLKRYLDVVDATVASTSTGNVDGDQDLQTLAEKLRGVVDIIDARQTKGTSQWPSSMRQVRIWIDALVHLCVTHKRAIVSAGPAEQLSFAAVLCALMTHPLLVHAVETVEAIFDLIAFLSDDFSTELRTRILRAELQRLNNDPRILFLFGSSSVPDAWLGLVTSTSALSTAPTSTPNSGSPAGGSPRPSPAQSQARGSPVYQSPPQVQRSVSHQRTASTMQPGFPAKPSAHAMQAGNRQGYTNSSHPQARQAQQGWPPAQVAQQQRLQSQQMQAQFGSGRQQHQGQASGATMQQQQQQQQPGPAAPSTPVKVQFNAPVPFPLRRWELVPDSSGTGGGPAGAGTSNANGSAASGKDVNDTAISLSLFGARRVK